MTVNRKLSYWFWALFLLMLAGPIWAETTANVAAKDEAVIDARLDNFHRAASEADSDAYFGSFSENGVFLGTDATERWSIEAFKKYAEPYFSQGKGWTYVPRDRTVVIHGDVAWFDELLDNAVYGECRGSGVLVKERGQWKIAQYNLHFPVPNRVAKKVTRIIKESTKPEEQSAD